MASIVESVAGDRASASRLLDDAQAVIVGRDDVEANIALLQALTFHGFFAGDLNTVISSSSEGVRLSREGGDLYALEMMLINLGLALMLGGDLEHSKPRFEEALRIAQLIDDRVAQYYVLDVMGCHAATSGRARLATQLLGAAETIRTGAGASSIPFLIPLIAEAEESATSMLGGSKFEAEFKAGKRLSRDDAIGLALGEHARVAAASSDDADAGLLGKRESQVARLLADGLTNKQIGARLFISEHTVDSHVRNILNKLGFNSRSQIAAWMASSNH